MNGYVGFYIDECVGNNEFSYDKRENKRIFVPPLRDGDFGDVRVSDNVVFNEIYEEEIDGEIKEVEIRAMGLESFIHTSYMGAPVYIFDNHNHAFYFWCLEMSRGLGRGMRLVHVDQHKDTRIPPNTDVDVEDLDDVFRYTNYVLNVGNFIVCAMEKGLFSELDIIDSSVGFASTYDDRIVLDIDLDIFSEDMDYIDNSLKVEKIREYAQNADMITICTSPYFIDQQRAIHFMNQIFAK